MLILACRQDVRATKRGKNLSFQHEESLKTGQSFLECQHRRTAHFNGYQQLLNPPSTTILICENYRFFHICPKKLRQTTKTRPMPILMQIPICSKAAS